MNLKQMFSWVFGGRTEARDLTLNSAGMLLDGFGSTSTRAGVTVTVDSAMQLSAVSACVRLISESIASLPLHVYEGEGQSRKRVTDMREVQLLRSEPNRVMSAFTFLETLAAHLLLWGNCYAYIVRNQAGDPLELLLVHPQDVSVLKQPNGELAYQLRLTRTGSIRVNQADIMHVPGLSFDGMLGMSPIRFAAQSIGLGLAAEGYGAAFFGNSSIPSGFISTTSKLTEVQARLLADRWRQTYGGANSQGTAILDNAAEFKRISIPPEEAQFIETRKFQLQDIARWYRVPPHMIGDLERATFSNIEHQGLEFVTHTLRPWLVRFEQEITRKLFPTSSSGRPSPYYVEFNVDGLLRGDIKSRYDAYAVGRNWGWLSVNDIRAKENMNPLPDGDQYLVPLNMSDASNPDPQAAARGDMMTALTEFARREQPAPIVNVAAPTINVAQPQIDVRAGDTHLSLPEGLVRPDITVNSPDVRVDVQPAQVNIQQTQPTARQIIKRDDAGDIAEIINVQ